MPHRHKRRIPNPSCSSRSRTINSALHSLTVWLVLTVTNSIAAASLHRFLILAHNNSAEPKYPSCSATSCDLRFAISVIKLATLFQAFILVAYLLFKPSLTCSRPFVPTCVGHGSSAATDASSLGKSSYALEPIGKPLSILSIRQ